MNYPVIVINYKTYLETAGKRGLELAKNAEKVHADTGVDIIICPQMPDVSMIASEVDIPVFAQHADAFPPGGHTGAVTLEVLKEAGCVGTLINHSERRMNFADTEHIVSLARSMNMETIICTNNTAVSAAAAALSPDAVAVEPPELIGGDISVTTADPEIVKESVEIVKKINPNVEVLCGAGVKNGNDVLKSIELGSRGVLLASGVAKAKEPAKVLNELVEGIIKKI